jgi:hypothetical protein
MQSMNRSSAATVVSRIVLVGETPRVAGRPAVRRYRLARVRAEGRASAADRYAHLRRCYD